MIYRNIKTGAVIDVQSKISGAWEPVTAPIAPETVKAEPKRKKNVKAKE